MTTYQNLIGGLWVDAVDGGWLERHNPADTTELVARFPQMGPADVDAAFAAAKAGFEEWRRTKLLDRGRILLDVADLLRERGEDIARDLTREMGKTLAEARGEVGAAAAFFEYFGGLARASQGDVLADRRDGVFGWTQREPLGVVLLITPWNDPLSTPARKLAPALITGNAIVLKPALETPIAAHNLVRALTDAGLPPGVVNTVTGPSSVIGRSLIDHEDVAAISFTGSTAVGLQLTREVAGRAVRIQTEMGGKNASIVLPDANLDTAMDTVIAAGCGQGGQRCTATSRVVVHRSILDSFTESLRERVAALRVGPGIDPDTEVGPLVSRTHLDSVLAAISTAQEEQATVAAGGARLDDETHRNGHFMAPTLITDVTTEMAVWREEIFGPVLATAPFDTLDEAIAMVNDNRYGLSASIFTRDLNAAHRAADELNTGQVAVNLPSWGWDVHVPFGGFKESGSPFKEHGTEGLRFYSRVKSVVIGYA